MLEILFCELWNTAPQHDPPSWFLSQPPQPYGRRNYTLTVWVIHVLASHNTAYLLRGYFDSHMPQVQLRSRLRSKIFHHVKRALWGKMQILTVTLWRTPTTGFGTVMVFPVRLGFGYKWETVKLHGGAGKAYCSPGFEMGIFWHGGC